MRINQAEVLQSLLAQEDTDGSRTITIDDSGPKHYTVNGEHGKTLEVKGTYYLPICCRKYGWATVRSTPKKCL